MSARTTYFPCGKVIGLDFQVLDRQVGRHCGPDLTRFGQVGEEMEQPRQHPMTVHGRVPIV